MGLLCNHNRLNLDSLHGKRLAYVANAARQQGGTRVRMMPTRPLVHNQLAELHRLDGAPIPFNAQTGLGWWNRVAIVNL